LIGEHQADNAALAIAGLWLGFGDAIAPAAIRDGLAHTRWPGRFEIVHRDALTIVLDGAHTPAAAQALAQAFRREFSAEPATIVLGVLRGKDAAAIAAALAPIAEGFVAVAPPGPRGLPADELAAALPERDRPVIVAASLPEAFAASESGVTVVTGSLTTVAAAREALGLALPDPAPASA
jgi:dihydrofolate synthase/folylpolyglutamate synthase